ncbi:hypothetical protein ACHAWF_003319, partial [Thalassiosira exigua]
RDEELAKAYEKMGWRYRYIRAGVSDADGELTFYKNAHLAREKASELGFPVEDRGGAGRDRAVVVPTIRLALWLEDEVGGRELPSRVYGTYPSGNQPRVVAKLDVESHEYAVLPNVLFTDALCWNVDFLFSELHGWNKYVDYAPEPNTGRGGDAPAHEDGEGDDAEGVGAHEHREGLQDDVSGIGRRGLRSGRGSPPLNVVSYDSPSASGLVS